MRYVRPPRQYPSPILRRVRAVVVAAVAGLILSAALAIAESKPSVSLTRPTGNGLRLALHWDSGIDEFDLYLVRHRHQQIFNLPGYCTPSHYSRHWDQVECVIKKSKRFILKFSVTPRYPNGQHDKIQIDTKGGMTTTIAFVGP